MYKCEDLLQSSCNHS